MVSLPANPAYQSCFSLPFTGISNHPSVFVSSRLFGRILWFIHHKSAPTNTYYRYFTTCSLLVLQFSLILPWPCLSLNTHNTHTLPPKSIACQQSTLVSNKLWPLPSAFFLNSLKVIYGLYQRVTWPNLREIRLPNKTTYPIFDTLFHSPSDIPFILLWQLQMILFPKANSCILAPQPHC